MANPAFLLFTLLFKFKASRGLIARQLAFPRGWLGRYTAFVMNHSNAALSQWCVDKLQLSKQDHALELGFGGGVGLQQLLNAAFRVEGLDRSRDMVLAALKRYAPEVEKGRLALGEGDLMALPLADHAVNAALSVNTVYFWPDPAKGAFELHRVLKPGGRLVLGLRPPTMIQRLGLDQHGFRGWAKEELLPLFKDAGFSAVRVDEELVQGFPSWAVVAVKA